MSSDVSPRSQANLTVTSQVKRAKPDKKRKRKDAKATTQAVAQPRNLPSTTRTGQKTALGA